MTRSDGAFSAPGARSRPEDLPLPASARGRLSESAWTVLRAELIAALRARDMEPHLETDGAEGIPGPAIAVDLADGGSLRIGCESLARQAALLPPSGYPELVETHLGALLEMAARTGVTEGEIRLRLVPAEAGYARVAVARFAPGLVTCVVVDSPRAVAFADPMSLAAELGIDHGDLLERARANLARALEPRAVPIEEVPGLYRLHVPEHETEMYGASALLLLDAALGERMGIDPERGAIVSVPGADLCLVRPLASGDEIDEIARIAAASALYHENAARPLLRDLLLYRPGHPLETFRLEHLLLARLPGPRPLRLMD